MRRVGQRRAGFHRHRSARRLPQQPAQVAKQAVVHLTQLAQQRVAAYQVAAVVGGIRHEQPILAGGQRVVSERRASHRCQPLRQYRLQVAQRQRAQGRTGHRHLTGGTQGRNTRRRQCATGRHTVTGHWAARLTGQRHRRPGQGIARRYRLITGDRAVTGIKTTALTGQRHRRPGQGIARRCRLITGDRAVTGTETTDLTGQRHRRPRARQGTAADGRCPAATQPQPGLRPCRGERRHARQRRRGYRRDKAAAARLQIGIADVLGEISGDCAARLNGRGVGLANDFFIYRLTAKTIN